MNIFILDKNPVLCAQYHNSKHVVKMILETTQLLNNALIKNNEDYAKSPIYRLTHKNHPASIWAATSKSNFIWLNELGLALCEEYNYRYDKHHKCESILKMFTTLSNYIPDVGLTDFVQCMPEKYHSNDVVEAYRNYYMAEKRHIANWGNRNVPYWWI
jgi:hypothetical protein